MDASGRKNLKAFIIPVTFSLLLLLLRNEIPCAPNPFFFFMAARFFLSFSSFSSSPQR
jgi:hypothetical protein